MADRIKVQVEFKKFVWTCPKCKKETIEDANVGGGNTYEKTCSDCGTWFNQSGSNMREYNGCINYLKDDYDNNVTESDVIAEKKKRCDDWLYSVKNPPAYVEPSLADYQSLYNQKMNEATEYLKKIAEKAEQVELDKNKSDGKQKIDGVTK